MLLDDRPIPILYHANRRDPGPPDHDLEGLGGIDNPGPVQRAFIAEQAAQCGFRIAGMIMRAEGLASPQFETLRQGDPHVPECEPVPLRHALTRILAAVRRAAQAERSARVDASPAQDARR